MRCSSGAVTLVPFWTPGPHVPPFEYFDALHGINKESDEDGNGTESGYDEDEEESGVDDDQDFVRGENDEDEEEAPHGRLSDTTRSHVGFSPELAARDEHWGPMGGRPSFSSTFSQRNGAQSRWREHAEYSPS